MRIQTSSVELDIVHPPRLGSPCIPLLLQHPFYATISSMTRDQALQQLKDGNKRHAAAVHRHPHRDDAVALLLLQTVPQQTDLLRLPMNRLW